MDETIKEVVESVDERTQPNEEVEKPKKSEETTPKVEETDEEEENEDSELSKRTQKALDLLDTLEDPDSGLELIKQLAAKAGLLSAETKAEEKKAEGKLKSLIKSRLGPELEFASDRIADAIEAAAEQIKEETRKENSVREQEITRQSLSNEFEGFISANKVSKEEMVVLDQISKEITPAPGTPFKSYLGRLLKLARAESSEKTQKTASAIKTAQNAGERLAAKGRSTPPAELVKKYNSIRDLVSETQRELLEEN